MRGHVRPPAPLPARRAYRPEGRAYASERSPKGSELPVPYVIRDVPGHAATRVAGAPWNYGLDDCMEQSSLLRRMVEWISGK